MNSDAPWWFIPLVTFGGVVLAQLVVLWVARSRVREDDKRRWHERRLETYAQYAHVFREAARELLSSDADAARADALLEKCADYVYDINLLSSDPVIEAAVSLDDAMRALRPPRPTPDDERSQLLIGMMQAKIHLDTAVRSELGISKARKRIVVEADGVFGLFAASFTQAWKYYKQIFGQAFRVFGIRISRR